MSTKVSKSAPPPVLPKGELDPQRALALLKEWKTNRYPGLNEEEFAALYILIDYAEGQLRRNGEDPAPGDGADTSATEASFPAVPPRTGNPEAASYFGRYDLREAHWKHLAAGLASLDEDLQSTTRALWHLTEILHLTGDSGDTALVLKGPEALRAGVELGRVLVQMQQFQERIRELRHAAES